MPSPRRLLLAACCSALTTAGVRATTIVSPDVNAFNWDAITPSADLEYHHCHGEFKCARLEVPLNWLNETDPSRATIAMIKLPATVPDDDPTFGGPIFTNPGGPGGSGVEFVLGMGRHLRRTADKPGRRHYEIVSFDPRGVGRTIPRSDCFPDNLLARDAFLLEFRGTGGLTNGDAAIRYSLALMDLYGQRCEQAGDAMAYAGTPNVARDMVEMVDKIDELRKREAAQRHGYESESRVELKKRSAMLTDEPGDVPRLQYIGFSYGTLLGNFFASMFPGRVGRLILDGVCDAEDYVAGPGWLTNTVDSEEIFDKFFEGCATAGPKVCALARDTDADASDIRARFDAALVRLDEKPRPVILPSGDAIIITGDDIRTIVGTVIYSPIAVFKRLAVLLDAFISDNLDEIARMTVDFGGTPALRDACPLDNNTIAPQHYDMVEARNAVTCADGEDIRDKGLSWWRKYVNQQVTTSSILGALWSTIRIPCSSWRIRSNWKFKGPFTSPKADSSLAAGRPAAPILFLSNRLDPVTPLRAARAMAAKHPGARVVVQEAMGHCAVVSAPSKCTRKVVADYFESGIIPSDESTCETECGPWDEHCKPFNNDAVEGSDAEAASAWFNMEEPLRLRRFPLGLI